MLYPVEKLLEDREPPLCVTEGDTVRDALVQMVENDYSQLPIVDSKGNLSGLISEQSITRNYYHLDEQVSVLDLPVSSCRDKAVTLPLDRDFFDVLDRLQAADAVVILDKREPIGILNHYDTANFFRNLTEGLILVEDIEVSLRQRIEDAFPDDEQRNKAVQKALHHYEQSMGQPVPAFEEMTFGDCINLVTNKSNWEHFDDQLGPRSLFSKYMEQVRDIRNQLAHFRGRMDAVQYDLLRRAREWLASRPRTEQYAATMAVAESPASYVIGKTEGKYGPLHDWLNDLAGRASSGQQLVKSFGDLEELLGDELPESAREHRAWWANDLSSSRHSKAWMGAGWKVDDVDFAAETVTFLRTDSMRYQVFFDDLLGRLKQARPGINRAKKAYPKNYLNFGAGRTGFYIGWAFGQKRAFRVELYIDTGDRKLNKIYFDTLQEDKARIESEFGESLNWARLSEHQASRIYISTPGAISDPPDRAEEIKDWALETLVEMVDTMRPRIRELPYLK